jgi:hypothetical protein
MGGYSRNLQFLEKLFRENPMPLILWRYPKGGGGAGSLKKITVRGLEKSNLRREHLNTSLTWSLEKYSRSTGEPCTYSLFRN